MSWLIFGILTGTAYLVQRGERAFPWYEWAFLFAAAVISTCVMPAALVVANAAVALIIYARRSHHQVPLS